MARGRPTRTTRLPVDLLTRLTADAHEAGVTLADLVEARCYPPPAAARPLPLLRPPHETPLTPARCSCTKPDPTPYGACRTCGLRR